MFICAIAGPMPGGVAAAVFTGRGIAAMTYDRFYPDDFPAGEVELAKIPIGDEETEAAPEAGGRSCKGEGSHGDRR